MPPVAPGAPATVFGPIVQYAYVVADPPAAAEQWAARFGAGPFFLNEHIPVTDVVHRGVPSSFDHTSAYGWLGGVMIELFCQHDRTPSAVTERFAPGQGGLHHAACFVDDVHDALRTADELGWSTAMTAMAGSTLFAFADACADLGHYIEMYVGSPALRGFYEMVRVAHEHWDGTEPVRRVQRG